MDVALLWFTTCYWLSLIGTAEEEAGFYAAWAEVFRQRYTPQQFANSEYGRQHIWMYGRPAATVEDRAACARVFKRLPMALQLAFSASIRALAEGSLNL